MDAVRRTHNNIKRQLIKDVARAGNDILDVGCGFGGDLHKWHACGVKITMCEPSLDALNEAKRRAKKMNIPVEFHHGDIFVAPDKLYDIICYNFSLQYIFESKKFALGSMNEIKKRLKPGGLLIGCIPDSHAIIEKTPFKDRFGNTFELCFLTNHLNVFLADTPYYNNGPISEPIAIEALLEVRLKMRGLVKKMWKPLVDKPEEDITGLYSKFIFENSGEPSTSKEDLNF